MCKRIQALIAVIFLVPLAAARADIFQWEYINPGNPGLGKQPSMTLCIDGSGQNAQPYTFLFGNLSMAYLIGADLKNSYGFSLNLTDADLSTADLTDAHFDAAILTNGNLRQANLSGAYFPNATLTGANFSGAEIRGANFYRDDFSGGTGITPAQLSSTASFLAHDLTNTIFDGNNLAAANLTGQKLTGATFYAANLTGADLTGADVRGANFTRDGIPAVGGITPAQLYTTSSYQAHDLTEINLAGNQLAGANLANQNLTYAVFDAATLTNANLSQSTLTSTSFWGTDLSGANLAGADVRGAYFVRDNNAGVGGITLAQLSSTASYQSGDLSGANFWNNSFAGANFAGMTLVHTGFSETTLTGADFSNADLTNSAIVYSIASSANFSHANLTGAGLNSSNFNGANLNQANLSRAYLDSATFAGADVRGAVFSGSNLTPAQLYSTASYLAHDLTGIDLSSKALGGWNFAGQNLASSRFRNADLNSANLSGANLSYADFTGAGMPYVNLSNANLSHANLTSAAVYGSVLTGANFTDAEVRGANLSYYSGQPGSTGISLAQLYTTASYLAHDLSGIGLGGIDLTGANFVSQNLTNAQFVLSGDFGILNNANFTQANLTGANVSGALTGTNFSQANLTNATVAGTMTGANFTGAVVRGATFSGGGVYGDVGGVSLAQIYSTASYQAHDLSGIQIGNADLTGGNFVGQDLTNARFGSFYGLVKLNGANFTQANLSGAEWVSAQIANVNFTQANLSNANFRSASLVNANFSQANLTGVQMGGNDLTGANFTDADVRGASIFSSNYSDGITLAQLYSTASYKAHDLTGIRLTGYHYDLTGGNFAGQNLTNASLSATLTGADFSQANLTNAGVSGTLTNANFSQANLTGAELSGSTLTGANFAGAQVQWADFSPPFPASGGVSLAQIYSTASYQSRDLSGIRLPGTNLANANFANQILSYASFGGATLNGANFTGATIRGADFSYTSGFTSAQLYSTASYQAHDLRDILLGGNDMTGWNFAGQNLTSANFFASAIVTGANFTAADVRGAYRLDDTTGATTTNLIQPNGHISGLDLAAGQSLVVHDYDGNPFVFPYVATPIPITVDQHLAMGTGGTLRMEFEADAWDSKISFAAGIPVTRGGTLELTFADGTNLASQIGRTLSLFDWTGVNPTGSFAVSSPYLWDLSHLYTTGDATLLNLLIRGDLNDDGHVDGADVPALLAALTDLPGYETFHHLDDQLLLSIADINQDNSVNNADIQALLHRLISGAAPASPVPEPSGLVLAALSVLGLVFLRGRAIFGRHRANRLLWQSEEDYTPPGSVIESRGQVFDQFNAKAAVGIIMKSVLNPILAVLVAGIIALAPSTKLFAQFIQGDVNRDGQVDATDGPALALALTDLLAYQSVYGITNSELLDIADVNRDGVINNQDVHQLFLVYNGGNIPANAHKAGMLYFSTSASNPGATSPTATGATNPNLTIPQGASTTLYIWAQVNDIESVNGLSLGITSTQGSVVTATGRSIFNPTSGSGQNLFSRWNQINPGVLGAAGSGNLLAGANAVTVNGNYFALDGSQFTNLNGTYVSQGANADGSGQPIVGSLLVGSITLLGNSPGTTSLFLNNGDKTINYEEGLGGPNIQFGAGDPQVNATPNGVIVSSQLADATITVVPEPSSTIICLLGILGSACLCRYLRRPRPSSLI